MENPSLVSTLPEFYSMVFSFMFTLQSPLLYIKLLANVHELLANAIFFFKPMQFLFFVVVVVQSLSCV